MIKFMNILGQVMLIKDYLAPQGLEKKKNTP